MAGRIKQMHDFPLASRNHILPSLDYAYTRTWRKLPLLIAADTRTLRTHGPRLPTHPTAGLDTGDLVLFDRPCLRMGGIFGAAVCAAAKVAGGSPFDHIGVVVGGEEPYVYWLLYWVPGSFYIRVPVRLAQEVSVSPLEAGRCPGIKDMCSLETRTWSVEMPPPSSPQHIPGCIIPTASAFSIRGIPPPLVLCSRRQQTYNKRNPMPSSGTPNW